VVCNNALSLVNTGNVRIKDVVVTGNTPGCSSSVLAPGESLVCNVVRTLTDADFVASGVTLSATATGTPLGTKTTALKTTTETKVALQQIRGVKVTLAPSKPDSAVVLAAGESPGGSRGDSSFMAGT
jgi:hypothetical protein